MQITSSEADFRLAAKSGRPCLYTHLPANATKFEESPPAQEATYIIGRQFSGLFDHRDGNFIEVTLNSGSRQGRVDRDSYGSIPLYYSIFSPLISTDPRTLFDEPESSFDTTGLGEYLSAAYISGQRTFYRGVKVLMPDEIAIVEEAKLRIEKKKLFPPITVESSAEVIELLENAITNSIRDLADRLPGGILLNLSGGADSSLILAKMREYCGSSLDIFSSTYMHIDWRADIDDWQYAEEVSHKYGTAHTRVDIDNERFRIAHAQLLAASQYGFHTYAVAFFLQNNAYAGLGAEIPIVNGSGPDESMIGTEKLTISDLVAMKDMPRGKWIQTLLESFDYLKLDDATVARLLLDEHGTIKEARKAILDELLDAPNFLEMQRRYHTLTVLQDHIRELSFVSLCSGRTIHFPYLTNDIFRIVFGASFECLNENGIYKSAIKRILERYLSKDFVYRKKIGFQSPSRPYFASEHGCGYELRRLLSKPSSSILNMEFARESVVHRLQEVPDLFKRHDFLEWAVYNLLLLEEYKCKT